MEYIFSGAEMRLIDNFTINHLNVSALTLMERAADGIKNELLNGNYDLSDTVIICGGGNNGGDGLALAALLKSEGVRVRVFRAWERLSEEAAYQHNRASEAGVEIADNINLKNAAVIVDALFGTGLSRNISGKCLGIINEINSSAAKKVSVDIPSGINADNGKVMGAAVRADITISIGYIKTGLILYPGAAYAGKIKNIDIGMTYQGVTEPKVFVFDKSDLALLPERSPFANKGSFGKVLIIGSQKNMAGASYLAAKGAFRSGCGMVKIFTKEENRVILQTLIPEAMLETYEIFCAAQLEKALAWSDTAVIGCGFGVGEEQKSIIEYILKNYKKTLVVDADALNVCAAYGIPLTGKNITATPHIGEMSRLLKKPADEIKENIIETARSFANDNGIICVLKDARTAVSDGDKVFLNRDGNSGMATAGSGDVLSGVIASLSAQGAAPFNAATLGVYVHALAGDDAKKKIGERGLMAGEIADFLFRE